MFPYNEYQIHEHRKDLLRSAKQARLAQRLARQALVERLPFEQFGWLLLTWGAKLVVRDTTECTTVADRAGRAVEFCPV